MKTIKDTEYFKFITKLVRMVYSGDDSDLRACPEGRKVLLAVAKDRRKLPLPVRLFPKKAGENARQLIDTLAVDVITGQEEK